MRRGNLRRILALTLIASIPIGCSSPVQEAPVPLAPEPAPISTETTAPLVAPLGQAQSDEEWLLDTVEEEPEPKLLSEYGLFLDPALQISNDDVLPYDLNTPHFNDYAVVKRFVRMPSGLRATYTSDGVFAFPEGALLIQTIAYPKDLRQPEQALRLIETRVLRRQKNQWGGVAYRWNDEGTEARRSLAGGLVDVEWVHTDGTQRTLKYLILNKNDCKRCHENEGVMLGIGPTAANLNGDFRYAAGVQNQLDHWRDQGYLEGAPEDSSTAPRLARWDDAASGTVAQRARAWLEVNCAHCHNPHGAGGVSGLDLSYEEENPVRIGIFKPPVAAGRGSEGHRFSIDPGLPEQSFLVNRLQSEDPSVMMPPVGRRVPSEEAIALLSAWISGMRFDTQEAEALKAKQQEIYEQLVKEGALAETGAEPE